MKKVETISTVNIARIVKELASYGHNQKEIAEATGLALRSVQVKYLPEYASGRLMIQKKLRRAQLDKALIDGNCQMLMHLGKFYLNQTDQYLESLDTEDVKELDKATTAELLTLVSKDLNAK